MGLMDQAGMESDKDFSSEVSVMGDRLLESLDFLEKVGN